MATASTPNVLFIWKPERIRTENPTTRITVVIPIATPEVAKVSWIAAAQSSPSSRRARW